MHRRDEIWRRVVGRNNGKERACGRSMGGWEDNIEMDRNK
jgi:hypothetical protein